MIIQKKLAQKMEPWLLLHNPFYQAWSMGTLPKVALQQYATEYGNFLDLLSSAWETLDNQETAAEETEHAELWQKFARSVQADVVPAQLPATRSLLTAAQRFFVQPATAMGAMYAFEVQQPATATSKLQGLQTHYADLHANQDYFEVHAHNEHESAKLLAMMDKLSLAEQKIAIQACAEMSHLLWETLTALHQQYAT